MWIVLVLFRGFELDNIELINSIHETPWNFTELPTVDLQNNNNFTQQYLIVYPGQPRIQSQTFSGHCWTKVIITKNWKVINGYLAQIESIDYQQYRKAFLICTYPLLIFSSISSIHFSIFSAACCNNLNQHSEDLQVGLATFYFGKNQTESNQIGMLLMTT